MHPVQVHLLRRMLEWQNDLLQEPLTKAAQSLPAGAEAVQSSTQVQILIVPTFKIEQVQRGTTAGDIIRSKVHFFLLLALIRADQFTSHLLQPHQAVECLIPKIGFPLCTHASTNLATPIKF